MEIELIETSQKVKSNLKGALCMLVVAFGYAGDQMFAKLAMAWSEYITFVDVVFLWTIIICFTIGLYGNKIGVNVFKADNKKDLKLIVLWTVFVGVGIIFNY